MRQNNEMLLSVSMLAYNHEKYIKQAIESVISQETDFGFELIIGDDCSTDKTSEIIEEIIRTHPKGHLIRHYRHDKNIGMQPNGNFIVEKSKLKYMAICEGDDYWSDTHKLQKQVDFLEANPDFVICFHDVEIINETKNELVFSHYDLESPDTDIYDIVNRNYIYTVSCTFRRTIKKFPAWFERAAIGDWSLYMLLTEHGGKIHYIPEKMAVYRIHGGGIFSTNNFMDYDKQLSLNNRLAIQYGDMITHFISNEKIRQALIKKQLSTLNKIRFLSMEHKDFKTTRSVSARISKNIPLLFKSPSLYISSLLSLIMPRTYSKYLKAQ